MGIEATGQLTGLAILRQELAGWEWVREESGLMQMPRSGGRAFGSVGCTVGLLPGEFLEDPASKYDAADGGMDDVAGKACRIVELTPTGNAAYRSARVWLDPETDLICRLEIHQDNGTVRTVTLRGVRINPELGAAEFAFAVPEGARVVQPPS